MFTAATLLVRAAAVILISATLLLGSTAGGAARTAQITCLVVGTITVLGWAAHGWRRRADPRPGNDPWMIMLFAVMAAAALACTTAHGSAMVTFALFAAVASGATQDVVRAWAVAGVGVLAITVGAVVGGAEPATTLGFCLEVVVALLLGISRRVHRVKTEQAQLLLAQAEQLRVEQAQVATLGERARIAREIHDVLAHSLGALNIQIQAARVLLSESRDIEQARAVLDRAQRIAGDGLDETRRAVHALRTDSRPLERDLADLADDHRMTHGVPVDVEVVGEIRPLPPDAGLALLRTAQESLVNAAKHSPGQPVGLTLTYERASAQLEVVNPLPKDDAPPGHAIPVATIDGGYGLRGMRERLLLLHGTLTAAVREDEWAVCARVPR